MQLSYSNDRAIAVAGMKASEVDCTVESVVAGETIYPGRAVVIDGTGKLVHPQATTLTKVRGVALYSPMLEQASGGGSATYAAGAMVPVMRKGRVWGEYSGGTQAAGGTINVKHSSTVATDRGKFTNTATSAVAGSEISAAPEGVLTGLATGTSALVEVELNLPA